MTQTEHLCPVVPLEGAQHRAWVCLMPDAILEYDQALHPAWLLIFAAFDTIQVSHSVRSPNLGRAAVRNLQASDHVHRAAFFICMQPATCSRGLARHCRQLASPWATKAQQDVP